MDPLRIALLLLFVISGVICFVAMRGVGRIPNPDTRRGLSWLLVLSGLWAMSEVGRLVAADPDIKAGCYYVGLVVGLATIGAWLYFCSAYTGHNYHRQPVVRRLAATVYLGIIAVKLTNPYHELYFTATTVTDPFPHLSIELMPAHWVVTGFAYALTAVGFYLLYELFSQSRLDTRALSALVLITGLPALLDILSYTGNLLLALNYEPVGVAIFAVGVLYVVDEDFVALPAFWREKILESLNDPVIVFDRFGRIRDYNTAALDNFPELGQGFEQKLTATYPSVAAELEKGADIIEINVNERTQYYAVRTESLGGEDKELGEVVVFSDVTRLEQQRQELARQNEQFEEFSEAITHELRNTLAIAHGYLENVADELAEETSSGAVSSYEQIDDAMDRMDRVTSDLSKLAQYGQTLNDSEECDIQEVITTGWEEAETGTMSLTVEADGQISADRIRLTDLFVNAFEFAEATGSQTVNIGFAEGMIWIETDGKGFTADEFERAFAYGEAMPSAETGMLLPTVRTIARVHGWKATAATDHPVGTRLEIALDPR